MLRSDAFHGARFHGSRRGISKVTVIALVPADTAFGTTRAGTIEAGTGASTTSRQGTGRKARRRHHLPALLAVLIMHGALIAVLLLAHGAPSRAIQPMPLEISIIDAPRLSPAPLSLTPPPLPPPGAVLEVPVPLVSIPDPNAMVAMEVGPVAGEAVSVAEGVRAIEGLSAESPQPITAPRFDAAYLHNPSPEYPAAARRMREQGMVLVRVLVSSDGTAMQVSIEQGSGSSRLDEAAEDAVRQWRFVPARRGTEPVEAWVLVPVEFKLHR